MADGIGTAGDQATLTLETESSGGAGDQAVITFDGTGTSSNRQGAIHLAGDNYLDIVNNGTLEVTAIEYTSAIATRSGTLFGNITNAGLISGPEHGIFHQSSMQGDIINSGTLSATGYGVYLTSDLDNFTNTGTIDTGSTGVYSSSSMIVRGDFTNDGIVSNYYSFNLGGRIEGSFINSGTMTGLQGQLRIYADFNNSGTITGANSAIQLRDNGINGNFINTGDIDGDGWGGVELLAGYTIAGNFTNEVGALITGSSRGVSLDRWTAGSSGGVIEGDFTNRGVIFSPDSAVFLRYNARIEGNFLNEVGAIISGSTGVYTSSGEFQGTFINNGRISGGNRAIYLSGGTTSLTETLVNNGLINGSNNGIYALNQLNAVENNGDITASAGSAIRLDGTVDNVFAYSGVGDLDSAVGFADIDMGAGTDVLNIANATLTELSVSAAETITIADSTLTLNITDLNKTNQVITTTGATSLSLMNVIFDFDSTAAIITGGTDLFLMESTLIDPANLGTLTANLSGAAFGGAFSIVDNGGIDELHFIAGAAAVPPAAGGSTFAGGSVVATQMGDLSQQAIDQRLQKKRLEFAALYSDSMYSIYEQPRSQVWAQGFGLSGSYEGDAAKGLAAYDTTLGGAVVGYDYNWGMLRTGIAGTYATGSIEGDANAFEIDVESFTGSLYSVIDFDKVYIETAASYGTTTFDQNLVGSGSSYDSENMGALLRVGMKLHAGNFGLEPFAGLQYKNVIVEEHFNGVDTVAEYNQEMVKAELGFTTSYQMMLDNGDAIVPYLRLETGHDFSDNATLTSLDGTGLVIGNPASVDLGNWVSRAATGVSLLTRDNYSISGEYEYEFRDKYEAHIGKIKGRLMF